MSLPINPQSQLVAKISADLQAATAATRAALSNIQAPNALDKAALESKFNELSGGLGSSLNWAGVKGAAGAVGDVAKAAQSAVSGATDTLQRAVPGVANAFADLSQGASLVNKLTGGNIAGSVQNFAATVSGYAGQINNLLSLTRGKDIPKGAELFAQGGGTTRISSTNASDWRVRIRLNSPATYEQLLGSNSPFMNLIKVRGGVIWPYLPNIQLTTKANYTSIDTTHSNYPFYAYKNSAVEDIQISGEFSAETEQDAAYWIAATMFLRTVTKMFFGQGPNAGNPPPICVLDGYGTSVFKNVPVIVKSFSVDFKDDVNYVYYGPTQTWVPIMSTVSCTVAPIYNRARLRQFDLRKYAAGQMVDSKNNVGMI